MVGFPLRCAAVAVLVPTLLGSACSDPPSDDERRAHLADDLVTETDGALDDEAARCVADALFDELGDDAAPQLLAARRGEDTDAVRRQVIDAFDRCDALGAALAPD